MIQFESCCPCRRRYGLGTLWGKPSPYNLVMLMLIAEEVVRGDRFDSSKPFRWDMIELNLPGSPGYDHLKPWIAKVGSSDGSAAADFFI